MTFHNPTRKKALLAIAFAGGLLQSLQPALSENGYESTTTETSTAQSAPTQSVVQQIAGDTAAPPEIRAYYLLSLAQDFLTNRGVDGGEQLKNTFQTFAKGRSSQQFFNLRRGGNMLVDFADQFFYAGMVSVNESSIAKVDANRSDAATTEALKLADRSADAFDRFYFFLIASRLFDKTGNQKEKKKCEAIVNEILRSSEKTAGADEKRIKDTCSFLDSLAYALIPVSVPDQPGFRGLVARRSTGWRSYLEADFKASEKLKLRAIALVDRLAPSDFLRRKAHRDLSLWYTELGQKVLGQKQKEILFELVGRKDDSLLYPKVVACGHLNWFPDLKSETQRFTAMCGMG
jgi:hypothetical protein